MRSRNYMRPSDFNIIRWPHGHDRSVLCRRNAASVFDGVFATPPYLSLPNDSTEYIPSVVIFTLAIQKSQSGPNLVFHSHPSTNMSAYYSDVHAGHGHSPNLPAHSK